MPFVLLPQTTNPDSNILTTKGLLYMEEVERHMVTQKGFDTHCYLNTDECSELTGGLKTSPTCCVTPILKDNVTDAHGCFLPRSPVYFFRKYGVGVFVSLPTRNEGYSSLCYSDSCPSGCSDPSKLPVLLLLLRLLAIGSWVYRPEGHHSTDKK